MEVTRDPMKLKEYLTVLKEKVDSGAYADEIVLKERHWRDNDLNISRSNQLMYLGRSSGSNGSFDDLANFMLKDEYWTFYDKEKDIGSLDARKRAFEDYHACRPQPEKRDFGICETFKEDIRIDEGHICFYNDSGNIDGHIGSYREINQRRKSTQSTIRPAIPIEKVWTNICLNGGHRGSAKSSAEGVLYFGEYALKNNLDFSVGPWWECEEHSGLYLPVE